MHQTTPYAMTFDSHQPVFYYSHQIFIVGLHLTIPLWIVVWRVSEKNVILKTKLVYFKRWEISSIICYYFVWSTKPTNDILFYKIVYHLRCSMLNRYCLHPLSEIIGSSENIIMTSAWWWVYWTNEINAPLLKVLQLPSAWVVVLQAWDFQQIVDMICIYEPNQMHLEK